MKLQVILNMMCRCPLLIAFLFYVDHVARLDAAGVHNRSPIFNNKPSNNWAVLVAGSDSWINYRHQANVFHAYHVLRANKIPAENIITFAYDDIANHPKNPYKGQVFNDYEHEDVYKGVVIDYRGQDVNPDIFAKVLKGDKELEKEGVKLLKSGPDDNVFIYYTGHGALQAISFPYGYLHAVELNDILGNMYLNKRYKKLVLYMDSCAAGSLFRDLLPSDVGIFVTTSANENEESLSVFCNDKRIGVCLATEYSYAWITDSKYKDLKKRTLDQQYEEVKKRTNKSHVMKYGEMKILLSGAFFLDVSTPDLGHKRGRTRSLVVQETFNLPTIFHNYSSGYYQLGHIVHETFHDIVMDVTTQHKPTVKDLSKRNELMCFKEVFDQFQTHCFTIQQVPEVARYTPHLMELCKAGYEIETLIKSVHNICS
ncbi:hypothetical protein T265_11001 [Opisthorchis viverrini]|uniref:Hemoglobinase n=1 Tax=Opisthorchis viverrini TaxID=6198 RepID=A0A074ZZ39_OPIVI|nr:hypothetical protein T265_11001 [Opisthorchis viverrini]KER20454.1 hypothetical protein T265_11001 [Opisthorchis viverrini]